MLKLFVILMFLNPVAFADDVIRISVGSDYKAYSQEDLRRRVFELERAVFQLQQKVFALEMTKPQVGADEWICKVSAMGQTFAATGVTKASAEVAALDKCKADPSSGNGFHCGKAKCSRD